MMKTIIYTKDMISVALPVYNSKKIAWLPMESFCRQVDAPDWELIIFEDGLNQLGEAFFMSYESRLKGAGCVRVKYMDNSFKFPKLPLRRPLPQKWVMIANEASPKSSAFVMCAADNYYHKYLVSDANKAIRQADWCIMTKGFFYDFGLDAVRFYHYFGMVGLTMTARTSMVRQFEHSDLERGIDNWFSLQMMRVAGQKTGMLKTFMDNTEHYRGMLCTNGLNNISTGRINYLRSCLHPFYKTDVLLEDIVPEDICISLKGITESMKVNDDLA
jgi:hypothetical protein